MNAAAIWAGAATASDLFLLIAAIVAGLAAIIALLRDPVAALVPAAICLIALGLFAL
jgi:hypothetical protein